MHLVSMRRSGVEIGSRKSGPTWTSPPLGPLSPATATTSDSCSATSAAADALSHQTSRDPLQGRRPPRRPSQSFPVPLSSVSSKRAGCSRSSRRSSVASGFAPGSRSGRRRIVGALPSPAPPSGQNHSLVAARRIRKQCMGTASQAVPYLPNLGSAPAASQTALGSTCGR